MRGPPGLPRGPGHGTRPVPRAFNPRRAARDTVVGPSGVRLGLLRNGLLTPAALPYRLTIAGERVYGSMPCPAVPEPEHLRLPAGDEAGLPPEASGLGLTPAASPNAPWYRHDRVGTLSDRGASPAPDLGDRDPLDHIDTQPFRSCTFPGAPVRSEMSGSVSRIWMSCQGLGGAEKETTGREGDRRHRRRRPPRGGADGRAPGARGGVGHTDAME
jgi:hypothetical protein